MILFHNIVNWNPFSINRDNGYGEENRGKYTMLMEDKNYDCVGNEAVITDCQKNSVSCQSNDDLISRAAVSCKSKKKLFVSCS